MNVANEAERKIFFRNLYFTFRVNEPGDWDVEVLQKERTATRAILEFRIEKMHLQRMRGAGKTARMAFGFNDFVIFQAFNLLQLLTQIRSGR